MTIGSVVLMDSTATGAIEALAISSISSDFVPNVVWVASRYSWALVSSSGGARGRSFVFLKASTMTESDCF